VIKQLVLFTLFIFWYQNTFAAAELLVKADSVSISGYSAISTDQLIVYGGIAGTACAGAAASTCDSCTNAAGTINACNKTSVHPAMRLIISFKVTKTVTGVAKLFIEGASNDFTQDVVVRPSETYTANSSSVTLETTWGVICAHAGLPSCAGSTAALLASKRIRFGVDSDLSTEVEEAETKTITAKLHYIPTGITDVAQSFCPGTTPTGAGFCRLSFLPGDRKVFIDTPVYAGADTSSTTAAGLDWDAVAVFPVKIPQGGESAAYTSFGNGLAQPVFKSIDISNPAEISIPDSQISAGLENYQKYCMVYAARNKAQNIYKYVTDPAAAATACLTPSEVVGALAGAKCFITTAAFGSQAAPEVIIFRKFRNEFLLSNFLGQAVVKFYYAVSPPLANFIAGSDYLKVSARVALYPLLVFAYISLKIGFCLSLILMGLLSIVLAKLICHLNSKKALVVIVLLFLTPLLRAEIRAAEKTTSHPLAEEGLVRIKKDGAYIYDTERPLKKESSRISLGQANHPEISVSIEQRDINGLPTGTFKTYNFQDFYNEDSGLILGYDYEWFPYVDKGRLGLQAGFSAMLVTGNGKLKATPNPPSVEAYTFATVPLTLGAVYRLEWKDKQIVAPYVAGGATYVVLAEKREDQSIPKVIGSFGYYATGGVLFNIGALDRDTSFQLDSEYGIGNMWLALEFRVVEVNVDAFSFSNKYVNAGISFDF